MKRSMVVLTHLLEIHFVFFCAIFSFAHSTFAADEPPKEISIFRPKMRPGPNLKIVPLSGPQRVTTGMGDEKISGNWSTGIEVDVTAALTGKFIPLKLEINTMAVEDNEGKIYSILARKKDENDDAVIFRAQAICSATKTYPFMHRFHVKGEWTGNNYIDLSQPRVDGDSIKYPTYTSDGSAEYFSRITCGQIPVDELSREFSK